MTVTVPPLARALLGAAIAFALAGCPGSGEQEKREPEKRETGERGPETRERVAAPAANVIAGKTWLQPTDGTPPDIWLASREAGADVAAGDPAVAAWRARLADADARFGETDRMIANRAAQLETMLGEIGIRESARQIMADFSTLAAPGARAGFSDLCQHYYNLRVQGLSREAAFAALRAEPNNAGNGAAPASATGARP